MQADKSGSNIFLLAQLSEARINRFIKSINFLNEGA